MRGRQPGGQSSSILGVFTAATRPETHRSTFLVLRHMINKRDWTAYASLQKVRGHLSLLQHVIKQPAATVH